MGQFSRVRVKRKGQVTIPAEARLRLGIHEGTTLEVEERGGVLLLKPSPPVEGGQVVGKEEHDSLIRELDGVRRNWR